MTANTPDAVTPDNLDGVLLAFVDDLAKLIAEELLERSTILVPGFAGDSPEDVVRC
jgi:hypothetical protein